MCSVCGDSGYRPAVRYGVGTGTGGDAVLWADHAVMEPCECVRNNWSPYPPHWPQAIIIPLSEDAGKVIRPKPKENNGGKCAG